jgi:carbon-monoxide dehydrogenase small subunit
MSELREIQLKVNGLQRRGLVEPRRTLTDFLRENLNLTGTHLGCEHGVCGACTVIVNGAAVRGCLMFAVQANNAEIITVEGLGADGRLHPVQQAFIENFAIQCGFCTPGFLITVFAFLKENPAPTDDEIRSAIGGNLCRCTGYSSIVAAVRSAAKKMRGSGQAPLGT